MVKTQVLIHAPIAQVFEVVKDVSLYPEFLSTTKEVNILNSKSDYIEAEFKIFVVKDVHYALKFQWDEPTELRWTFLGGDFMKDNQGAWKLEEKSDETTLAHYQVDVRFGWMVPGAIVDKLTKHQLPELMTSFKDRCEQLYKRGKKANG